MSTATDKAAHFEDERARLVKQESALRREGNRIESEAVAYYKTAPEFHPHFSPVRWCALFSDQNGGARAGLATGIYKALDHAAGEVRYKASHNKPGLAVVLMREIDGKAGDVVGFLDLNPGSTAGSLSEISALLVQELAPAQGDVPSRAFALAVAMQASLASGAPVFGDGAVDRDKA